VTRCFLERNLNRLFTRLFDTLSHTNTISLALQHGNALQHAATQRDISLDHLILSHTHMSSLTQIPSLLHCNMAMFCNMLQHRETYPWTTGYSLTHTCHLSLSLARHADMCMYVYIEGQTQEGQTEKLLTDSFSTLQHGNALQHAATHRDIPSATIQRTDRPAAERF